MLVAMIFHLEVPFGPVNVSEGDQIVQTDKENHGLEDIVQEPVQVDVAQRVVGHGHNQPDAVVILPPQELAVPGQRGQQRHILGLAEQGHSVEGGQQRKG